MAELRTNKYPEPHPQLHEATSHMHVRHRGVHYAWQTLQQIGPKFTKFNKPFQVNSQIYIAALYKSMTNTYIRSMSIDKIDPTSVESLV